MKYITLRATAIGLLGWSSHQRTMSCFTCFREAWDLGTLPVNVRTSRAWSLSMIRQCRNSRSGTFEEE